MIEPDVEGTDRVKRDGSCLSKEPISSVVVMTTVGESAGQQQGMPATVPHEWGRNRWWI